jgi:hypothetical protein
VRSLSGTLTTAQKAGSRAPFVEALFSDRWGDRPRLRFTRYYTGSEEEGPVAVVVAPDGSLVRARVQPSDNTLYKSRVTTPGAGSDYSSWAQFASVTVTAGSGIAMVVVGSAIWLFYVTGGTGLKYRISSNNGATFGGENAVLTAGGTVGHLAAAVNGSGHVVLFWNEGATVYRSRYDGSTGGRGPRGLTRWRA